MRLAGVRAPKPILDPASERRLSARQLELLDDLQHQVKRDEFAHWTMAEIASRMGCSLRTLYGIAPSKEELILTVVDCRMRRIGRKAFNHLDESMSPVEGLRAYLKAAHVAVQPESVAFASAFSHLPGAKRLVDRHEEYVAAVTQALLERAQSAGEIIQIDTVAVAHLLGGLGRELGRPGGAKGQRGSVKETADALVDVILKGLAVGPDR
ncbi:MAG: hypothetical protein CL936_14460 [Deltaproteobacteria bacterium]|nr:hypothetical protein [Deltaproteobacteria bacterium]